MTTIWTCAPHSFRTFDFDDWVNHLMGHHPVIVRRAIRQYFKSHRSTLARPAKRGHVLECPDSRFRWERLGLGRQWHLVCIGCGIIKKGAVKRHP